VRNLTPQLLLPESGREDNAITTLSTPDRPDRGLAAPMHLCKGGPKAQVGTHCNSTHDPEGWGRDIGVGVSDPSQPTLRSPQPRMGERVSDRRRGRARAGVANITTPSTPRSSAWARRTQDKIDPYGSGGDMALTTLGSSQLRAHPPWSGERAAGWSKLTTGTPLAQTRNIAQGLCGGEGRLIKTARLRGSPALLRNFPPLSP
jgi:hypothetical protein